MWTCLSSLSDVTHASTRGGHAYLESQARTPSHLQITSGDVGDALLSLSKYLFVDCSGSTTNIPTFASKFTLSTIKAIYSFKNI